MSELIARIEEAAQRKGVSFFRIERDLGLGNGTIKRWAGQSPRLDKLVAVADYLDASLDVLVFGALRSDSSQNGEAGPSCDGVPLSQTEADLVAMFRYIGARERETAFDFVTMLYEKATGEKGVYILDLYRRRERTKKRPRRGR